MSAVPFVLEKLEYTSLARRKNENVSRLIKKGQTVCVVYTAGHRIADRFFTEHGAQRYNNNNQRRAHKNS